MISQIFVFKLTSFYHSMPFLLLSFLFMLACFTFCSLVTFHCKHVCDEETIHNNPNGKGFTCGIDEACRADTLTASNTIMRPE